jgi:hypothetical protein
MKKIVAILLCLMAIGAGYYLWVQKKSATGQYARYLPQDAVATVSLTHLNTITDTFAATALGRFVAKDTVHAMMQEMRAQPQSIEAYDALYDSIVKVMTNPAFRAVFGTDAALALLPPDRPALTQDPVGALRSSLVVFATTAASGALDLFGTLAKSKTVTRETIDGLELTKITLEQNQVIYGYVDQQTVLLAYAPAAIKACTATRKTGASLDKTGLFQEATAFWQPYPSERIFTRSFVNATKLAELMKVATNPEVKQMGEWMQGIESMVSLTYTTEQGLESRGRSKYRYDQLHPLVKSAVDSAAKSNQSLSLLKEGSLAYNWASSLRPELLMKSLQASEQNQRQVDTAVRQNLGISLDELGRAVGPQYGGVLDDIIKTGLFPVPKLILFLEVRDRKIAETAFNVLRRKIGEYGVANEVKEAVAGNTIYSWPILPGELAQPAMVLTDSMFYLASSKQALKDILTSTAPHDALAAPVTKQLGPALSERIGRANFSSFVLYPERMSRQTGDMIGWLADILAATKNISLSRFNREFVQLMQATELLVMTTNLSKEQVEWTMTLKAVQGQSAKSAQ